ncbi:hypothetical protein DFQ30_003913 [Apophysomyces sp. BC1015]|nr:hypothetical protein DFQ30_003913 [Apophysomyces sp. BC1015]KAG0179215.1 hypothetical protein DFQ29_002408 [Apophysomyces sp. BC1021]
MLNIFGRRAYSTSSKSWIQRQARDPYVKAAKSQQYRARSAFKLLQLNDKYRILRRGQIVVDCGAAPGGWTQVAVEMVQNKGKVIAVDLLPMDPLPGATVIQGNFLQRKTQVAIKSALQDKLVNVVCSDMAPSFSGNHLADHARSMVK